MADTANYTWTKPTVGGDDDTWGTVLNTALDAIDTSLQAVEDASVKLTGTQTVAGAKTFSDAAVFSSTVTVTGVVSGGNATADDHLLNRATANALYPSLSTLDVYEIVGTNTDTSGTTRVFTLDTDKAYHRIEGFCRPQSSLGVTLNLSVSGDGGSTYTTPVTITSSTSGQLRAYVRITLARFTDNPDVCVVDWVTGKDGDTAITASGVVASQGTTINRLKLQWSVGDFNTAASSLRQSHK